MRLRWGAWGVFTPGIDVSDVNYDDVTVATRNFYMELLKRLMSTNRHARRAPSRLYGVYR